MIYRSNMVIQLCAVPSCKTSVYNKRHHLRHKQVNDLYNIKTGNAE